LDPEAIQINHAIKTASYLSKLVEQEGRLQLAISAVEKDEIPSLRRVLQRYSMFPNLHSMAD
jgi:hypothetical protein